ncbi:hypothetical protein LOD99_6102 [Oopsacas minuta]|uniref:Dehydrogenase/reductase SDR family member 11 n=1 Tax=Oopsacas minuta TaxID=111878 RepID=A0AAV7JP15_9METZ|nr:hypothetical protein LOD99_6102 [Oopsacas minuta]
MVNAMAEKSIDTCNKKLKQSAGRVAIITGASSGIGLDLLKALASRGIRAVGCARSISRIEELCIDLNDKVSGHISAFKCDVRIEHEVKSMFEFACKKYGSVDILVNNAGVGHDAPLLTGDTECWKNILDINILGLSICTREFYQHSLSCGVDNGDIINICSIVGHVVPPSPRNHFYSASKHAVTALTEGTRQELSEKESNIKISQISPGLVHTAFHLKLMNDEQRGEEYYKLNSCLDPRDVSQSVLYLLSTPAHVCVHEVIIRPTQQLV